MEDIFYHEPVLLNEVKELLLTNKDSTQQRLYVDCTLGGGGYTKMILDETGSDVKVLGIDKDEQAIRYSKKRLEAYSNRLFFNRGNFRNIKQITGAIGFEKVSGIVMDLGLSSYQIESEDGFSYQRDTVLDMRADSSQKLMAKDILNSYSEKELFNIIHNYGELKYSRQISRDIVSSRNTKKFESTFDLAELLKQKIPYKYVNRDLSKVFQALRIEVNNELENLELAIDDSAEILEEGGRIVIVSYHSLEDRIVKNKFRSNENLRVITKKPVEASEEEISKNTRARSAKLRTAEKVHEKNN
ncbi:MAG TPA: 16S rRNA (cytosine(1402)-N(4))-methyltransferase RsmH [Ignavibacteria bacterium]|nr:16S rRNA (cytosine(1402)-N(4))-methyltransferase RsmH [Ignavibacteria bacterium]